MTRRLCSRCAEFLLRNAQLLHHPEHGLRRARPAWELFAAPRADRFVLRASALSKAGFWTQIVHQPFGWIGPFTTLHPPQASGAAGWNWRQLAQFFAASGAASTYLTPLRIVLSLSESETSCSGVLHTASFFPQPRRAAAGRSALAARVLRRKSRRELRSLAMETVQCTPCAKQDALPERAPSSRASQQGPAPCVSGSDGNGPGGALLSLLQSNRRSFLVSSRARAPAGRVGRTTQYTWVQTPLCSSVVA